MLKSVRCDKETFNEVHFKKDFNIVLAERTKESTKRDSRNGLGKSTLIQIIQFCLGGSISKTLSHDKLKDWTFILDIEILGKNYSIYRSTTQKNHVIVEGDCSSWIIQPEKDDSNNQLLKVGDWNKILGELLFGLKLTYPEIKKYKPTFRSCISYFARLNGITGGFLDPFTHFRNQMEWDKQVNNSFLLGLDWTYASKWQILKDRKKVLGQIREEAESGFLKGMIGSIGELEAKKVGLENQIKKQELELETFQVHPRYHKIERTATKITAQIHELVNNNVSDNKLLGYYNESVQEEKGADIGKIEKMYNEAGVLIPQIVVRRLEEVKIFHENIITNRRKFLESEINRLRRDIIERGKEVRSLSEKRAELLNILKKHKALDEYTELQKNTIALTSKIKDLENRLINLKKFEQGKSALKIDIELLQQQARISLDERTAEKNKAIDIFNSCSQALYESSGILSIDTTSTGYKFKVDIEREGSHGISNMKIFCYDLMLARLWADRDRHPGFLIHDSLLFADVDERQTALALELAANESRETQFQYICTLNSDTIPYKEFSEEFDLDRYIIRKLTDATESGCLLGIRF